MVDMLHEIRWLGRYSRAHRMKRSTVFFHCGTFVIPLAADEPTTALFHPGTQILSEQRI